jgi:hypothetical protein
MSDVGPISDRASKNKINSYKIRKIRRNSVDRMLDNLCKQALKNEIVGMLNITVDPDDWIGWQVTSGLSKFEVLGMLDSLKHIILLDMEIEV